MQARPKVRLLLVDDQASNLIALKALLDNRGYELVTASSGKEALAQLLKDDFALILLDVQMPGMDGFETASLIRGIERVRHTPIIFVTAIYRDEAYAAKGYSVGAADYLYKPIDRDVLLAKVSVFVDLYLKTAAEQLQKEQEAAEAAIYRERAINILESITDAFITLDQQWRFTFINRAAQEIILGGAIAVESLIGKVIWQEYPALIGSKFETEFRRAVSEQRPVEFEEFYRSLKIWLEVRAYPAKDGLSIYLRDITGDKQAEQERTRLLESERAARKQAEDANHLKDEFLATVSHELRTPLTSILGWARLIGSGKLDANTAQQAIVTIERNAKLQARIVDDLLDISKIITGKLALKIDWVDLIAIIEASVENFGPAAEAKEIKIQQRFDSSASKLLGDEVRLQQIIWNLLSNSVKFTPRGGRIEIHLERVSSHIEITVIDTGKGINSEFLPYVFERFRQADSSITRIHGGLGLGLALVRHLVELHGGSVSADSKGDGEGATFKIKLPVVGVVVRRSNKYRKENETTVNSVLDKPSDLSNLRVLVVDDDLDTLGVLTVIFEQCGSEVKSASSAGEALELVEKWLPDILISDIGMPGENGYELIRKVRALEMKRASNIPSIALTAFASAEDRNRALAAGFNTFIAKPVYPDKLVELVVNLLKSIKSEP